MADLPNDLTREKCAELIGLANDARDRAYAPYSNHAVGAAVLTKSGRVFTGSNVENASYGLTICAERTALVKAVSEAETTLLAICVSMHGGGTPCGACRQSLAEFGGPDTLVITHDTSGGESDKQYRLSQLLPEAFRLRS